MSGYFCIGFANFMLKGKRLTEYNNLLSRNKLKVDNNKNYLLKLIQLSIKINKRMVVITENMYPHLDNRVSTSFAF